VDNIDLEAAEAKNVIVVNAPEGPTISAAEHTLALMLSLSRAVPQADRAMKSGQWIKKQLVGSELMGKILGIIGVGRIGKQVAKRAAAFGMTVVGCDPLIPEEEILFCSAEPSGLEGLCARADYISLNVPLTSSTRNMIDGPALAIMKPGVRLISTARGGVIDEAALLAALESGQVAGAALDVFAQEPPGLTDLVAHPHVIATPHIAAQTAEAQARTAEHIAHEVLAALDGKPLRWRVV
jgi:D-3-phosphoglycerate dehydrogenase